MSEATFPTPPLFDHFHHDIPTPSLILSDAALPLPFLVGSAALSRKAQHIAGSEPDPLLNFVQRLPCFDPSLNFCPKGLSRPLPYFDPHP